MTRYTCDSQNRFRIVKDYGTLNGIAYLEVRDTDEPVQALRQRTLFVRTIYPPAGLTAANVRITGGERIPTVEVEWAAPGDALPLPAADAAALIAGLDAPDHVLVVRTRDRGDFSTYRFEITDGGDGDNPPNTFDPLLAAVTFSFKVECPSDFDCAPVDDCPPDITPEPAIDYLVKDYDGFRRLMLERMALLAPGWTERNAADQGVALVELLAYVADALSYRQDAIATEAFLGTARNRVSLRRLARLVDYAMHDGCNARSWVRIDVNVPDLTLPAATPVLTRVAGLPPQFPPDSPAYATALLADPVVFETMETAVLHQDLSRLSFYTWGETGCCLDIGATSATLLGHHPKLRAGDVLVLAEIASPGTGQAADADPAHRQAVRLVDVRDSTDPSGGLFQPLHPHTNVDVTEIRWAVEDALTFPLCVAADDGLVTAEAWGNIVAVDHGMTVTGEPLADVTAKRYRPAIQHLPLTFRSAMPKRKTFQAQYNGALQVNLQAAPAYGTALDALLAGQGVRMDRPKTVVRGGEPAWSICDGVTVVRAQLIDPATVGFEVAPLPATIVMAATPHGATPAIKLHNTSAGNPPSLWEPVADLLGQDAYAHKFVVECSDVTTKLRFGDGVHGAGPAVASVFTADYRYGNGTAGNVGAESLAHVVIADTGVQAVTNPLAAGGGTDPELAAQVRRDAPYAFQVQERAVTAADYADVVQRRGDVQRAAATFRWTGSWHTVFVTADRLGGVAIDPAYEQSLLDYVDVYRMAGYDADVDAPIFVPLEVDLLVCAEAGYHRGDVERAVLDVLSARTLPDGSRGLFHPDNFTFGQPVWLSSIYAAALAVPGVASVTVTTFQRQRLPETSGLDAGVLDMSRLEIAQLSNDPNFPERGVLELTVGGGS